MKLNIIRYCMLLLGAMLMLVSCNESVDADKYNRVSKELLPTFATQSDSLSFDRVKLKATITLNGDENIMESGFFVSANDEFPEVATSIINAEQHDLEIEKWVDKLVGSSTYYYKAYTYSENGFAFSEVKSITTDEPPVFEDTYLFGTYNQIDHSIFDGTLDYEELGYWDRYGYLTIKQVENTYNQVEIYNFWSYGQTIIGIVDFEKKEIAISPQKIYVHENNEYDPFYIRKWGIVDGNPVVYPEDDVIATYDEEGTVTVHSWGAFILIDGTYRPSDACSTTELIKKEE